MLSPPGIPTLKDCRKPSYTYFNHKSLSGDHAKRRSNYKKDRALRVEQLKLGGSAQYEYSNRKKLGFFESQPRQVMIDFEELQVIYPDVKGNYLPHDISSIVSTIQTEEKGGLQIVLRKEKEDVDITREKTWIFNPPGDVETFLDHIGTMSIIGLPLKALFKQLDEGDKGYLTAEDLEKGLTTYCSDESGLTNPEALMSECSISNNSVDKVRFRDLYAIMSVGTSEDALARELLVTPKELLLKWCRFVDDRLNANYFSREDDSDDSGYDSADQRLVSTDPNHDYQKFLNGGVSPPASTQRMTLGMIDESGPESDIRGTIGQPKLIGKGVNAAGVAERRGSQVECLLIEGEMMLANLSNVIFTVGSPALESESFSVSRGGITITNYRVVLYETSKRIEMRNKAETFGKPALPSRVTIPLGSIARVDLESNYVYELVLVCKDLRVVRMGFAENVQDNFPLFFKGVLESFAYPPKITDIFAFKNTDPSTRRMSSKERNQEDEERIRLQSFDEEVKRMSVQREGDSGNMTLKSPNGPSSPRLSPRSPSSPNPNVIMKPIDRANRDKRAHSAYSEEVEDKLDQQNMKDAQRALTSLEALEDDGSPQSDSKSNARGGGPSDYNVAPMHKMKGKKNEMLESHALEFAPSPDALSRKTHAEKGEQPQPALSGKSRGLSEPPKMAILSMRVNMSPLSNRRISVDRTASPPKSDAFSSRSGSPLQRLWPEGGIPEDEQEEEEEGTGGPARDKRAVTLTSGANAASPKTSGKAGLASLSSRVEMGSTTGLRNMRSQSAAPKCAGPSKGSHVESECAVEDTHTALEASYDEKEVSAETFKVSFAAEKDISQSEEDLIFTERPSSIRPDMQQESTSKDIYSTEEAATIFIKKPVSRDGWELFNPTAEYLRQGITFDVEASDDDMRTSVAGISTWRIWSDKFTMVETYPSAFILPGAMKDREILEAAKFRSRCRLPALTWLEKNSGACLVRSSQPMTGFSSNRNVADKLLLDLYRTKGSPHSLREQRNPSTFYVIDCRSQLAANANAAFGKGVENMKHLNHTKILFCGIANIHTMRSSLEQLHRVLIPWLPTKGSTGGKSILAKFKQALLGDENTAMDSLRDMNASQDNTGRRTVDGADPTDGKGVTTSSALEEAKFFLWRVEETGWLEHVRTVIGSSILVAEKLSKEGCSVLVHCSDGWDRTAQVCSTAQLILDPYYRTLEGIAVLIEKDWCAFGHKFHDRTGHAKRNDVEGSKEISPIFVQWLDVVSQFVHQFPKQFEFNEDFLVFLADSLHSCLFGTFLGNSERQRKEVLKADKLTTSMWTYVFADSNIDKFRNENYKPSPKALWPSVRKVRLWDRYWCRWDLDMHPRDCTDEKWLDDWP